LEVVLFSKSKVEKHHFSKPFFLKSTREGVISMIVLSVEYWSYDQTVWCVTSLTTRCRTPKKEIFTLKLKKQLARWFRFLALLPMQQIALVVNALVKEWNDLFSCCANHKELTSPRACLNYYSYKITYNIDTLNNYGVVGNYGTVNIFDECDIDINKDVNSFETLFKRSAPSSAKREEKRNPDPSQKKPKNK